MGSLLRFLLGLAGRGVFVRGYLSPVAKTIDMLPVRKPARWFWGGLVHYVPVVICLAVFFALRRKEVTHGRGEIAALIAATLWALVGPALLWYYERYTLPILNKRCTQHVADPTQRRRIQQRVYSSALESQGSRLFVAVWMGGIVYAFLSSRNFARGFGIRSDMDPFLWVFLIGILFLSFYTALGCCLAYKSVRLVHLISHTKIKPAMYHEDRVMGLSFVGDFALWTNVMFSSGWLFVPLLFVGVPSEQVLLRDNRVLLILSYALFGLMAFLTPVFLIHGTIRRIKQSLFQAFGSRASDALGKLSKGYDSNVAGEFEICRSAIADTHLIRDWPLSLDALIRASVSTLLLPVVVGLVLIWLDQRKP